MVSGERATFFQGFCFFFLSLDFFYFLFFFIPQSEKKRGRDSFFLCTSVLAEGALLGFKRERIFHALEKGRIFFFYYQEADFHFFLNFRLGLLRVIQAVSALLVEMSLEEKLKKMILHLSFFFCFEET